MHTHGGDGGGGGGGGAPCVLLHHSQTACTATASCLSRPPRMLVASRSKGN